MTPNTRWVAEDTRWGSLRVERFAQQIAVNGLTISFGGQLRRMSKHRGDIERHEVSWLSKPKSLAAGDLFRVSQSVSNTSDTNAVRREMVSLGLDV